MANKEYLKTTPIKAEQFDGSSEMLKKYKIEPSKDRYLAKIGWYLIKARRDKISFKIGDYITTDIEGEHWPIKKEIFERTYEELPAIPKHVAEYIEAAKNGETDLDEPVNVWGAMEGAAYFDQSDSTVTNWFSTHGNEFARAWLDGYRIEEDKDVS
ncbi:MAG: DUF1642 domain-containing protein [Lactobacillus sp.]|jgi:hypothetical protein|nr:DUF1642 domain-containing protein [Lactobacillus sp.]